MHSASTRAKCPISSITGQSSRRQFRRHYRRSGWRAANLGVSRLAMVPRAAAGGTEFLTLFMKYSTRWYSRANPDYGYLSPRAYLGGRTWDEQFRIGLSAL